MFVVGFAIGPLFWAPLSETFGRQRLFFGTYLVLTIFNAAACGSPNIAALIIFRFLSGAFGSSPLTNAGGVIADMFPATQRGIATSIFAMAPFLGPALGKPSNISSARARQVSRCMFLLTACSP
jgi:MFS family permease